MLITKRIDAITRIPAEYRCSSPPVPRSVKIELTARCDLNCFFCATGMKLREKGDMDLAFFQRLISELSMLGVKEIGLFYLGESFLYSGLSEAVKVCKENHIPYVFLTTNGRLATYERVKACVDAGLDSLKFSLNADNSEQYWKITGVNAFPKVIQNIKDARRAINDSGRKCGLYVSSILYDESFRERMAHILKDVSPYIDEHYWLPLYGQAGLTAGARNTLSVAGNIGRVGALRESLPCWACFTEGHVTYDGFLSACCFDHDGRFHMGDLKSTPFMEAWHSQAFQKLRKQHLSKDVARTVCENCIAYGKDAVYGSDAKVTKDYTPPSISVTNQEEPCQP